MLYGVQVDGSRKHVGVFESVPRTHQSPGTGEQNFRSWQRCIIMFAHCFKLLGIIRGLDYLHVHRVVHGNLKGVRTIPFSSLPRHPVLNDHTVQHLCQRCGDSTPR